MSIIDTLITDRTAADVSEWKKLRLLGLDGMTEEELAEWNAGMKGAYKASDFNRVSSAYNFLAGLLRDYGAITSYTTLKTNWANGDTPLKEDRDACIDGINALKRATNAQSVCPTTFDNLTYVGANDIENTLIAIDERAKKIEIELNFAGQYYAGEV